MKGILSSQPILAEGATAIVRIITGLLMVYHGWEVWSATLIREYSEWEPLRQYSHPLFMVYVGKSSELMAGLLLTLGLCTRIAAFMLILIMLYITFKVGGGRFWYEDQHPFMFVLIGLLFLFAGGGKYSMDKKLFG